MPPRNRRFRPKPTTPRRPHRRAAAATCAAAGLAVLLAACGGGSTTGTGATTATTASGNGTEAVTKPPVSAPDSFPPGKLVLQRALTGLDKPLGLTAPPNDPRLFVVEQGGKVRVSPGLGSPVDPLPYLDLSSEVNASGNEQGLLGLAFHPDFARNGRLYVNFTNRDGNTRVLEITVDPASDAVPAVVKGRRELLAVEQPYENHNGGGLAFGPDRLLYVGLGDGGSAGDPEKRAQNDATLLGKMVRIDVDRPGSQPAAWAKGLRNPWRFSFDFGTGRLWIGDVGQDTLEEIDVVAANAPPGANFGWSIVEGTRRFKDVAAAGALIPPVYVYAHSGGNCAVIGGYVYRGPSLPGLDGRYVFGDGCSGRIWTLDSRKPETPPNTAQDLGAEMGIPQLEITSFGTDAAGRLYVVNRSGDVDLFGTAAQK